MPSKFVKKYSIIHTLFTVSRVAGGGLQRAKSDSVGKGHRDTSDTAALRLTITAQEEELGP